VKVASKRLAPGEGTRFLLKKKIIEIERVK
jgi:hypothetical protein